MSIFMSSRARSVHWRVRAVDPISRRDRCGNTRISDQLPQADRLAEPQESQNRENYNDHADQPEYVIHGRPNVVTRGSVAFTNIRVRSHDQEACPAARANRTYAAS